MFSITFIFFVLLNETQGEITMLDKDKMMASELVAELQRLITQCGDQPVGYLFTQIV